MKRALMGLGGAVRQADTRDRCSELTGLTKSRSSSASGDYAKGPSTTIAVTVVRHTHTNSSPTNPGRFYRGSFHNPHVCRGIGRTPRAHKWMWVHIWNIAGARNIVIIVTIYLDP
jgi:hypothetical protein